MKVTGEAAKPGRKKRSRQNRETDKIKRLYREAKSYFAQIPEFEFSPPR